MYVAITYLSEEEMSMHTFKNNMQLIVLSIKYFFTTNLIYRFILRSTPINVICLMRCEWRSVISFMHIFLTSLSSSITFALFQKEAREDGGERTQELSYQIEKRP